MASPSTALGRFHRVGARRSRHPTHVVGLDRSGLQPELDPLERYTADIVEAAPRERHLAVLVHRWDASTDPAQTPPPTLADRVDVLWVVVANRRPVQVWTVGAGEHAWRI